MTYFCLADRIPNISATVSCFVKCSNIDSVRFSIASHLPALPIPFCLAVYTEKLVRIHTEYLHHFYKYLYGHRRLPALNTADCVSADPCLFRNLLLRHADLIPPVTDTVAQFNQVLRPCTIAQYAPPSWSEFSPGTFRHRVVKCAARFTSAIPSSPVP